MCESADGSVIGYEPFVEDLRTQYDLMSHPVCWADQHGVEALVELIERRNQLNREGFWKTWKVMQEMKDKLIANRLRPPDWP